MERVIADGITYIPIDNLKNSLCYHVAVVHLLHTSATLNQLLLESNSNQGGTVSELFRILLRPNVIYAQTNEKNYKEKYNEIKDAYQAMTAVMSNNAMNGYSSFYLLYFYYLPILYRRFPEHFIAICEELSIDSTFFKTPFVNYADVLRHRPFLKEEYTELFESLNRDLHHANIAIERRPLKGAILEIYPNAHSVDGGHAIFLLRTKKITYQETEESEDDNGYFFKATSITTESPENVYYIFDDATTIDLFQRYLENRDGFIAKICVHTTDEEAMSELQTLWGKASLTKRANNRFELTAESTEHKNDIAKIASSFIQVSNNNTRITGGTNHELLCNRNRYLKGGDMETTVPITQPPATSKKPINVWMVATAILIVILIIDIIFGLTHGCYKQSFIERCPCKRKMNSK